MLQSPTLEAKSLLDAYEDQKQPIAGQVSQKCPATDGNDDNKTEVLSFIRGFPTPIPSDTILGDL